MTPASLDRRDELEQALPGLVDRLVRAGAKRIVLFGSLARGDVGPNDRN